MKLNKNTLDSISFSKEDELKSEVKHLNDLNKRYKEHIKNLETQVNNLIHITPPNIVKKTVRSGDYKLRIIIPDLHGDKMCTESVGAMFADLKRIKIPKGSEIVILGDLLDCGGWLAEKFVLGFVAETETSFMQDVASTNYFLNDLQGITKNIPIHYLEGNHEHRLEQWCVTRTLRHQDDAEMLRQMVGPESVLDLPKRNIKFYRRGEFYHKLPLRGAIKLGLCHFTHGICANMHAAKTHADKFGGNVCYGHTHRMDSWQGRSVSTGTFGAWCPGTLSQLQPLYGHNNISGWTNGYAIQIVDKSEAFLHINIPIIDGMSYLGHLL
jgi:UDP-2,3-diacylglucosamine pyrophosphatase LpxH